MDKTLHNKIMRRVYYAYAIRVVGNPLLLQGFLMLALMIALEQFVSLGNVLHNLMAQPVYHLGVFFFNAATRTEVWTYLILGALIFSAFSFRVKLRMPKKHAFQRAHV